jgi:hypothetical protein
LVKSSTSSKIKKFGFRIWFGFYMALLERKEEILKPKRNESLK